MVDPPCGVVGFYTENGEHRSSVTAVGAGDSVYIFKNMRPFFKYCLPHIEAHPKEREVYIFHCYIEIVTDIELIIPDSY